MEISQTPQAPPSIIQTKSSAEVQQQRNTTMEGFEVEVAVDYSKRAQWLRAAVLGANDGLLSTASLMMGVGAVQKDAKSMVLAGIAGLVGGACSMAIGEFVSVYSQYDIEMSQMKRELENREIGASEMEEKKKELASPWQAAGASAFAFAIGALVPLVAALFIKNYHVRLGVVIAAVTLALLGFGWLSAVLGRAPVVQSSLRVLFGGWLAMGVTFGLTKLIGSTGVISFCGNGCDDELGSRASMGIAARILKCQRNLTARVTVHSPSPFVVHRHSVIASIRHRILHNHHRSLKFQSSSSSSPSDKTAAVGHQLQSIRLHCRFELVVLGFLRPTLCTICLRSLRSKLSGHRYFFQSLVDR
ncbi:Ccc1 family [Dillenia turbinata]|uniref:Ccc1 family n=1 Tax=Dillenia turbinata TaxID=194707 RepID=A0AAN8V2L4_9MAGN